MKARGRRLLTRNHTLLVRLKPLPRVSTVRQQECRHLCRQLAQQLLPLRRRRLLLRCRRLSFPQLFRHRCLTLAMLLRRCRLPPLPGAGARTSHRPSALLTHTQQNTAHWHALRKKTDWQRGMGTHSLYLPATYPYPASYRTQVC